MQARTGAKCGIISDRMVASMHGMHGSGRGSLLGQEEFVMTASDHFMRMTGCASAAGSAWLPRSLSPTGAGEVAVPELGKLPRTTFLGNQRLMGLVYRAGVIGPFRGA